MATGGRVTASFAGPVTGDAFYIHQEQAISSQTNDGPEAKKESLGSRTIEGIQADGTRITRTIPAGAIGNDKELVITHETWRSPDLKLVLLSTQDDPRFGQTTYSLTNIQQGQPDETLFQIPTGYKVENAPVLVHAR
jgi:hypothetical protein